MPKVTSYMKNVAKSFGYALGDTFSEYNPVIRSIAKETKDTTSDIYQTIKSFTFKGSSIDEKSLKSSAKDAIDDMWKNIKDDLKSGNWYNKERKAAADMDMAKAMGFDFDFDFDFDDMDLDDLDDSSKTVIESGDRNAKQIINAVDSVGGRIASTVATATTESASYIVASSNKASRALYSLNERGFTSINHNIAALNNTISSFAQIATPLSAHMQNSALFYANTTKTLNEMNQSIHQLVKNTTPAPVAGGKRTSIKGTYSDLFDSDGMINIDSYKEMVKDNFKDYKDLTQMGLEALKKLKQSGAKNISPMQFTTVMMTKAIMPKIFKESMKSFNESLKYAISGGLMDLRDKDTGNLALELLKDLFVPKDGYKNSINTKNYNKGAVAWDGKARKALVEVIPEYLSGIYKLLSGKDLVYDYDNGRFISRQNSRDDFRKMKEDRAKSAGGEFRDDALNKVKNNEKLSASQKAALEKEIEGYFLKSFEKGKGFNEIYKQGFAKEFGLSPQSLQIIQGLIEEYQISKDPEKRNRHNKFRTNVHRERDAHGNQIRELESEGTSNIIYIANGFSDLTSDVQQIVRSTSGGKGKKPKKGKKSKSSPEPSVISSNDYNFDIPLDEDEAREKEHEERVKEASTKTKSKFRDILSKITGFFSKDNPKGMQALYRKPFESVSYFLDNLGLSFDKLLWGGKDGKGGVFDWIIDKAKDTWKKLSDSLEEKFKIKEKWEKVKQWFMDGGLGEFKDQTVDSLKKAAGSLGNTVKQFFGKRKVVRRDDIPTAAYGRKVTKSGIVAVSEGELIVPSELNPFYHGATNKAHQRNNERRLVNNFYGMFADGGIPIPPDNDFKERARQTKERLLNKYKIVKEGKGHQFIRQGFETLGEGAHALFNSLFGDGDEETVKKDNKIIKTVMSKLMGEIGDSKGAMGAGALIGAGVSVATGAVVGPLFGAAIGAAAGLVVNSKTVQKILFGEVNEETGEVDGGLLSKSVSNFMVKNVPAIAKGGAIGGIGGLFLGSPLIGTILGAGVGFATSSEQVQDYLFGKRNSKGERMNGGLISPEVQKRVKEAAPTMAAGALAGLALGPFGIVGNLLLGTGLGYLATTKDFKGYIFGTEKEKGLAQIFKEKIFNNLDIIFHNMGNAIAGWSKNLLRETSERLKDFFTKRARAYENGEQQGFFGKLIGGAVSLTGKAVKGVTNKTGDVLGKIASFTQARNLAKGYRVYDIEKKRDMFSEERNLARGGKTDSTFGKLDEYLSGAKNKKDLLDFKDQLLDIKDPSRIFKRTRNKAMNKLFDALRELDPKKATKIANLVQKGDIKALSKIKSILTPEEFNKYLPAIEEALKAMEEAKNSKASSMKALKALKAQGMDFSKSGDLNSAIDSIDYELTQDKFSDEAQEKKEEKDWRTRVLKVFESLDINVAHLAGKKNVDGESSETNGEESTENGENSSIRDLVNNLNKTKEDAEADTKTEFVDGNPVKYRKNSQGEWDIDDRDGPTKEAMEKKNKVMDALLHIPLLGTAIGGLHGLFSSFAKKLFGDKEGESKGLFGSLLSFLNGEDGPLAWLTSLFTGTKIGSVVKSALSRITLGGVLTNIVGPMLLAGGFSGKFDEIVNKLSNDSYGEGGDSNVYYDKETGETLTKNENGDWVDSEGNVVTNVGVREGDVSSFSERLKYNTVRGVLTNTKSVASTVLGKTAIGKKVASGVKAVVSSIGDDAVAIAARKNLIDTISEACTKFALKLVDIPALAPLANSLDDMGNELAETIGKKLASESAEQVTKLASNLVMWVKIAFIVIDFTTGYEDARTTLGIVQEPTVGQRIIAGLLRAIKNFIPIIGSLIPDSLVIDVFCKYVAPALGMEPTELMKQREESKAIVDAYNAEHGTDYSIEKYNKTVLQDYTWTERIGNAAKSTWLDTKNRTSNMISGIKEKGLGGYIGDSIKGMASDFVNSYKETGGGISGIFNGMGTIFQNLLPGILGEVEQKKAEIMALAHKGQLKELWKVSLSDFSQGKTTEEGITTAVPGIFSKIIGQIPLILAKIVSTPMAINLALFNKLKDGIEDAGGIGAIFGKLKDFGNNITGSSDLFNLAKEGDIKGVLQYSNADENDNGFVKVIKAIPVTITKFTAVPTAIAFSVGKSIVNRVTDTINKVKGIFNLAKEEKEYGMSLLFNKDSQLKDFFTIKDEDPENPMGGFAKAFRIINRLTAIPTAILGKIGNGIKDGFNEVVGKVKNSIKTLTVNFIGIQKLVRSGDPESLWKLEMKEDPENPVGGITTGLFHAMRIMNLPSAGMFWLGREIKDGFNEVVGKVKNSFTTLVSNYTNIQKLVRSGDPESLWKLEMEEDPENPVGGITTGIFHAMRVMNVPNAGMFWLGGKIKGEFDKVVGKVKNSVKTLASNYITINSKVKSGDVSGLWNLKMKEDPENPVGGITTGLFHAMRVMNVPSAGMFWLGGKIKGEFDKVVGKIKNSFSTLASNYITINSKVKSGDVSGLWNLSMQQDPENPVGGITTGIFHAMRVMNVPNAAMHWAGIKIKGEFDKIVGVVKNSLNTLSYNQVQIDDKAKSGDILGLWKLKMEEDPENPVGGITTGIFHIMRIMNIPSAAIHYVGGKIKDGFTSMTDKTKSNYTTMTSSFSTIKKFAKDGDIKSIWTEKLTLQDGDPLKFIWSTAFDINRLFQSVVAIFSKVVESVKDTIDDAKETIEDITSGDFIADKAESAYQGIKNWISGGDSGINNSGFVSQFDSKYKDAKLGSYTVAEKGCGPAVATMISNHYGAGINMDQAIKTASKYQDRNGTKIQYFRDILGSNGIETDYLPGKNIHKEVVDSLYQGRQVILLGRDEKNTSKKNSPFGPNNHYVIASGIDKKGNIIIKDPESNVPRTYNPSILKNAITGIHANGSGGASNFDTDIARKVWSYFTSNGYTPAATAGIMANLYAESGMNPERLQNGGGPAAGIAQWENYTKKSARWALLNQYAQDRGYAWSELDPQLMFINEELQDGTQRYFFKQDQTIDGYNVPATTYEDFKNSSDPVMAALQFEKAFERAGIPHMANRVKYAGEYYKLYHDSNYTGNYTPSAPTGIGIDSGNYSYDGTTDTGSTGIAGILSTVSTAFSNVLGNIFNKIKGISTTDSTTSSLFGSSVNVVNGAVGLGNKTQKALVSKLIGIQGKLAYDMKGPRNPDAGSADCSSTVNWAYKNVTGTDIGNDTGTILNSNATEVIDLASNMDKTSGGTNSSGPNVSKLMPGDILLYSRPTSDHSVGRPYRVGHVEMYVGNNQRIGHGTAPGPRVTDISTDSNRYIMAKRLKGITSAAGSGLVNYGDIARMSGGSSGLLLSARPGAYSSSGRTLVIPKGRVGKSISGGDSALVSQTTSMLNNLKSSVINGGKSGTISSDLVEKLLAAIIKVLETISNNTSSVDKIYQVLLAYTQAKTVTDVAKTVEESKKDKFLDAEIDANISNLVGTLAAIAKG